MISPQSIDRFAKALDSGVKASVYEGTRAPTVLRREALWRDYDDPDALRRLAAQIKQHTLDHLDEHLERAVPRCFSPRMPPARRIWCSR
jgi:L-lactate dehydrogenase complex protein LldF